MSVLRWKIRRFAAWFVPVLAFLLVLILLIPSHKAATGEPAFESDEAYRHFAVARTLHDAHMYGTRPDQPVPMLGDTLWRAVLAAGLWVMPNAPAASRLAGMLFGALTLLLAIRLCLQLFPYPLYSYITAGLLIVAPGLALASLSGLATPLAMCLVTYAVAAHLRDQSNGGGGLPLSAAVCIGLALWLRMEFILVWFLLWVHAVLMAILPGKSRASVSYAAVCGLNGLLLLSLFLLPIFVWNVKVLGVPWPRLPGVPVAANSWALEGAQAAWQATHVAMSAGWAEAGALFRDVALPSGWLPRLFWWLGMAVLLVEVIRSEDERPYLLLLLLPWGVPLFCGALYPYLGGASLELLSISFLPIGYIVAAYGLVRLPFLLEKWLAKHVTQWPVGRLFQCWWGIAGTLLFVAALIGHTQAAGEVRAGIREASAHRDAISAAVEAEVLTSDRFISDQPGWLVWRHGVLVLDTSGIWTPDVLGFVKADGALDLRRLGRYVEQLVPPPGAAVFWEPDLQEWQAMLPSADVLLQADDDHPGRPLMLMGIWADVI